MVHVLSGLLENIRKLAELVDSSGGLSKIWIGPSLYVGQYILTYYLLTNLHILNIYFLKQLSLYLGII